MCNCSPSFRMWLLLSVWFRLQLLLFITLSQVVTGIFGCEAKSDVVSTFRTVTVPAQSKLPLLRTWCYLSTFSFSFYQDLAARKAELRSLESGNFDPLTAIAHFMPALVRRIQQEGRQVRQYSTVQQFSKHALVRLFVHRGLPLLAACSLSILAVPWYFL